MKYLILISIIAVTQVMSTNVYSREIDVQLPELPNFLQDKTPSTSVLPSLKTDNTSLNVGQKFLLNSIQFNGNTVLKQPFFDEISQAYVGKMINLADLNLLKDKITRAYIQQGYLNTGVVLPNQHVKNGRVQFNIVEGKLVSVSASTDGRLNTNYVAMPLSKSASPIVNIFKIEERLQLLQQDIRIKSISARLAPSNIEGQAILKVKVKENTAYDFRGEFNNNISPSIGAEGFNLAMQHDNLTGNGNQLIATAQKTAGFSRFSVNYMQPRISDDSRFEIYGSRSQSRVVDENYDQFDIMDKSYYFKLSLRESFYQSIYTSYDWFISSYFQSGATFLLGEPFSFGDPRDDGEIQLGGLIFGVDWKSRLKRRVILLGLSANVGIPLPDDDDDEGFVSDVKIPNGKSLTIKANLQLANKFSFLNARLISRLNLQLSSAPLYGVQQFSLGGHATVRGYRENTIVRDNGFFGSIELRIPVMIKNSTRINAALFADGGRVWQTSRTVTGVNAIASLGVGLLGKLNKHIDFRFYWAKALRKVDRADETNFQDQGFHFSLSSHWR